MIALAREEPELPERKRDELDLENSRSDLRMVGSLAKRGLLSADRMVAMIDRLEKAAMLSKRESLRVRADQTLAATQLALLKLLKDLAQGPEKSEGNTVNQQINVYLPSNGRDSQVIEQANGNGRH